MEWCYNIHDALNRFKADNNVQVFKNVLEGVMDEDVYYDNLNQLQNWYNDLTAAATGKWDWGTKGVWSNC